MNSSSLPSLKPRFNSTEWPMSSLTESPLPMLSSSGEKSTSVDKLPEGKKQADMQLFMYGVKEISTVMQLWKQLEQRLGGGPLAAGYDWTECWLETYKDVVQPWFVVGLSDQTVRGLCLLSESTTQKIGPLIVHSLHLGTAGERHGESVCVEYNDVLVEPEYREEFFRQLETLLLNEAGWDQFQLDGIPAEGALHWPLLTVKTHSEKNSARSQFNQQIRLRESRYFDLEESRQSQMEILDSLGKSTRSNLKRRLKQIGEITVEWAETLEQAQNIFDELIELHQARWQSVGQPGAFASSRFERFQKSLIQRLFPRQQVVLARIKTPEVTVGCLYLLVDRNRLLDYVSGFISFEEFPSPGLISHYLCMCAARDRGFDAYDFLVGDKRHKENLGKSSQQLQWIVLERPRRKYKLRHLFQTGKLLIKKVIGR